MASSSKARNIIKRVLSENAREYAFQYALAIACLAIISLSTAFIAWIMKSVINAAFVERRADLVWGVCLAIFIAFVLRGFASYGQAVILSKIGNNIAARYQVRAYSHLLKLSLGFFNQTRSARIVARLNQNISGVRDVMNLTITSTVRDLLTFVSLVSVMFMQEPWLSFFVFLAAPPLSYGLRKLSKRLRAVTSENIHAGSYVFSAMQETVQGIAVVKAFTLEKPLQQKFDGLLSVSERRANKITRVSERSGPLIETVAGFAVSGVIAYAAYRSVYYNVPPGGFLSFLTALLLAYDPARRLARVPVQLATAVTNAEMIYELLDTELHQRDLPDAKPLVVTDTRIEFRNVSFGYGHDEVLKEVSFVAEGGKTTALVGPSGAGKSTIITLIPRFYDPRAGEILIDGQDIAHVTKQSLREQLAYVSQQPYLFEGTIRDNIRYGRPEASDEEVERAAGLAYAHDFILAQPQGYDTPVGENGVTLSGGQRQRLSIARALVRNAPILLLDEATSALDTESEAAVQKALDEAMVGRTVVVIAHRLSTVVGADKIVVMQDGRVVEEGNHDGLSQKDSLYARLARLSHANR
ncbi:ABC transporter ATP-binding protein [Rhizobium sp. P32RR-XVIII]|uniref:ABC transporter ATP-binding protein n=1 Tax=Rhizobium sp. P32RR-XVIII TaxID=2726738 RepID=UPI00145664E7|nr:ABC transporter ATP-binding protein [Rhizobium sp. P32RR-XVIII]NLS01873.1 ABC transporter ATP-binding protein [Rhizobium sp. P32RR-XVIII]